MNESGEGEIRTPGELAPTLVFETSTIGHSVTSPGGLRFGVPSSSIALGIVPVRTETKSFRLIEKLDSDRCCSSVEV
jgi:hypothetical protein